MYIRIISFSDFRSHTNQLFVTQNVLKFREIIKLNHLQLLNNFLNDSLPTEHYLETDKEYKTNVSFSQIYNMNQFKQVLKRHFVYNYSLE